VTPYLLLAIVAEKWFYTRIKEGIMIYVKMSKNQVRIDLEKKNFKVLVGSFARFLEKGFGKKLFIQCKFKHDFPHKSSFTKLVV